MKTIEEAYQELHDHDTLYHERSHKECCAEQARALALAVLEAAFDHRYVEITKGSDAHRLAMRARIERLGE